VRAIPIRFKDLRIMNPSDEICNKHRQVMQRTRNAMAVLSRANSGDCDALRQLEEAIYEINEIGDWMAVESTKGTLPMHLANYCLVMTGPAGALVAELRDAGRALPVRELAPELRQSVESGCRAVAFWAAYLPVLICSVADDIKRSWWDSDIGQAERDAVRQFLEQRMAGQGPHRLVAGRVTVGALRDACQGLLDAISGLADDVEDTFEGEFELWTSLGDLMVATCCAEAASMEAYLVLTGESLLSPIT